VTPRLDTVDNAAATPEEVQPFADLGLKPEEYQRIRDILGRRPTAAELAMYSVMWSEHCSYKSSKVHLSTFAAHTTDAMRRHLLVGIGENAGVTDIGDGWAVTFKAESHNHPSFVEPYDGAATGVGGLVRDIMAMGARPVAVLDQLRVGAADHPDTARVLRGAVAGATDYSRDLGVPMIGGELVFDAAYQGNPLVNVVVAGVLRHEDIHLARAQGEGNVAVLFGARTGSDGVGSAISASETFEEGQAAVRSSVPKGDPELERRLIECCLAAFSAGVIDGIQDLGAAGISCATSELAAGGNSGMHVFLDRVKTSEPLTAEQMLMSESQERMMGIVSPGNLTPFVEICERWQIEFSVIGEVNDSGRLTIDHQGQRIVDVDPRTVAHHGPVYRRAYARPAWQDGLVADTSARLARPGTGAELRATALRLLASPNLAGKAWLTAQADSQVQGNTVLGAPHDAGVVVVDHASGLGVALTADANGRYTKLDPRSGAQLALAEAYRNVAVVGATPRAVSDCLNFGSPENPDSMWQLVEAIEGLAEACEALAVPVTGGNVSLYNETGEPGRIDSAIHPTPLVAVLGVLPDARRAVPSSWPSPGLTVVLLGSTRDELDGSAWADVVHGHLGGRPPRVDLNAERRLAEVLIESARQGWSAAAHDLSEGGLVQALVESSLAGSVGVSASVQGICAADGVSTFAALFAESSARALVAVTAEGAPKLLAAATDAGVQAVVIGVTGGADVVIRDDTGDESFVIPLDEARAAFEGTLPALFG
jgi:phosphoribosylformylglycinamidine synthase